MHQRHLLKSANGCHIKTSSLCGLISLRREDLAILDMGRGLLTN